MEYSKDVKKYELFIDVRPDTGFTQGYGIIQPSDRSLNVIPETDFFISVFLSKSTSIYEYVDVQKDETIQKIERQNINPYFIEFGFFDTIVRNKTNRGSDLSNGMVNYIRSVRQGVLSAYTDLQIVQWFDYEGKNSLPWFKGTTDEVTIDDIDKSKLTWSDIISKANFYPIDINK